MTWASALAAIVAVYGTVMGVCPLLQLLRMRATRSSRDVSIPMLVIIEVGSWLWLLYGLSIGSITVVVPNGAAIVACGCTLAVAIAYRRRIATLSVDAQPGERAA